MNIVKTTLIFLSIIIASLDSIQAQGFLKDVVPKFDPAIYDQNRGLVARWSLDGDSGGTITDSIGGSHGQYNGTIADYDPATPGDEMEGNFSINPANNPESTDLDLESFTYAFRTKPDSQSDGAHTSLLHWRGTGGEQHDVNIMRNSSGELYLALGAYGSFTILSAPSDKAGDATTMSGQWHEVALSYHAPSKMIRLYVNGKQVINNRWDRAPGDPVCLGLIMGWRNAAAYFGQFDDLRVWNVSLTDAFLLRGVVFLEDDGPSDDTQRIQDALNYVKENRLHRGGMVYLAGGNYTVTDHLVVWIGISLIGSDDPNDPTTITVPDQTPSFSTVPTFTDEAENNAGGGHSAWFLANLEHKQYTHGINPLIVVSSGRRTNPDFYNLTNDLTRALLPAEPTATSNASNEYEWILEDVGSNGQLDPWEDHNNNGLVDYWADTDGNGAYDGENTHPERYGSPNDIFNVHLKHLHLKVGKGNPGLIGIIWTSAQESSIYRVTFEGPPMSAFDQSETYFPYLGLVSFGDAGGGYWKEIELSGAKVGMVCAHWQNCVLGAKIHGIQETAVFAAMNNGQAFLQGLDINDCGEGIRLSLSSGVVMTLMDIGIEGVRNSQNGLTHAIHVHSWSADGVYLQNVWADTDYLYLRADQYTIPGAQTGIAYARAWASGNMNLDGIDYHNEEIPTPNIQNHLSDIAIEEPVREDSPKIPVCVTDFGAAGDNLHDDTAAIQAAIDAAQLESDGKVWFPAGTYRCTDQISLHPNTELYGFRMAEIALNVRVRQRDEEGTIHLLVEPYEKDEIGLYPYPGNTLSFTDPNNPKAFVKMPDLPSGEGNIVINGLFIIPDLSDSRHAASNGPDYDIIADAGDALYPDYATQSASFETYIQQNHSNLEGAIGLHWGCRAQLIDSHIEGAGYYAPLRIAAGASGVSLHSQLLVDNGVGSVVAQAGIIGENVQGPLNFINPYFHATSVSQRGIIDLHDCEDINFYLIGFENTGRTFLFNPGAAEPSVTNSPDVRIVNSRRIGFYSTSSARWGSLHYDGSFEPIEDYGISDFYFDVRNSDYVYGMVNQGLGFRNLAHVETDTATYDVYGLETIVTATPRWQSFGVGSFTPDGDADQDSISDLIEMAMLTDPFDRDSGGEVLPRAYFSVVSGQEYGGVELSAPSPGIPWMRYFLETSTDLVNWSSVATKEGTESWNISALGSIIHQSNRTVLQIRNQSPMTTEPFRFYRLVVEDVSE